MERSRWTRWPAGVEVVLAAVVVALDLFLPALVLVALGALSLVLRRERLSSLGFRRPRHVSRLVVVMLAIALTLTAVHVTVLDPLVGHLTGRQQDTSDFASLEGDLARLLLFLVLSWTLAALVEEAAFRGYLMTRAEQALGGGRAARIGAVVVSAVLFGLIHTEQGLVGVLLAAVDGAVFGVLRQRWETLWAPVLVHGFVNTIGFVAFFLAGPMAPLW